MRVVTFAYHDVLPAGSAEPSGFQSADAATYAVELATFASHLDALAEAVDVPVTTRPTTTGAPQHILTFDDGGVSALTHAAPALEAHGWRGAFFVTTRLIGTPGFLDRAQVRELADRGHLIGSHSASHKGRMSRMPREKVRAEWRESLDVLADITGRPITSASVPSGYSSRTVAEEADACGITELYTQEPTTSPTRVGRCTVLGRYTVRRWTTAPAIAALARRSWTTHASYRALWLAKQLPKALPGGVYTSVRRTAFRWGHVLGATATAAPGKDGR